MKIKFKNGFKIMPEHIPTFLEMRQQKQAEEDLKSIVTRMRHKRFNLK